MSRYVLSFKLERSGRRDTENTIGVCACVMDDDLNVVDKLTLCGYFRGSTTFEDRYYETYWRDRQELLELLVYEGEDSVYEREANMVMEFLRFLLKWETKASAEKLNLSVVPCDVLDMVFLDQMIFEHTEMLPLPNPLNNYKVKHLDLLNQQRGLLYAVYPECDTNVNSLSDVVNFIYNVKTVEGGANDALSGVISTATDQHTLFKIRSSAYVLSNDRLKEHREEAENRMSAFDTLLSLGERNAEKTGDGSDDDSL